MNHEPIGPMDALNRLCGFHQYWLDTPRHVCYVNQNLCDLLGASEAELLAEDRDGYLSFLHPEDRGKYEDFWTQTRQTAQTKALQYRLVSRAGQVIHVLDTVTAYRFEGRWMADSVLADVSRQQQERLQQERGQYLRALSEVYDKIFEFDRVHHIVKCLYGHNSPSFRWLQNIPMEMESATENWITSTAAEGDREALRRFFGSYWERPEDRPARIFYHARSSSGEYKPYAGIFLRLDDNLSLYCCRCCQNEQEAEALRQENDSLKNVQALTMQFTQGMVAFEVEDNRVRPLLSHENVCSFFGYTQEQWSALAETRPTIREFSARNGTAYSDIQTLFSTGEAEFPYFDIQHNTYRRVRAICSRKYDGVGKCYVMLYRMEAPRQEPAEPMVYIRTFGYFDVFVGEKPIAFRNEKAKELFALLVDRKGGFISSEDAIGFLWEDEPANSLTMARYRKVALRLKNTLEEYGAADIVESVNGKRRLIPERVKCDLYDYLSGNEEYAQLFKGSYLTNYTWGETTLAELTGEYLYPQEEH